jgi:hypothetical protein
MRFIGELKRRNPFKVAVACLDAACLIVQRTEILIPMLQLREWVGRFILLLLSCRPSRR